MTKGYEILLYIFLLIFIKNHNHINIINSTIIKTLLFWIFFLLLKQHLIIVENQVNDDSVGKIAIVSNQDFVIL